MEKDRSRGPCPCEILFRPMPQFRTILRCFAASILLLDNMVALVNRGSLVAHVCDGGQNRVQQFQYTGPRCRSDCSAGTPCLVDKLNVAQFVWTLPNCAPQKIAFQLIWSGEHVINWFCGMGYSFLTCEFPVTGRSRRSLLLGGFI